MTAQGLYIWRDRQVEFHPGNHSAEQAKYAKVDDFYCIDTCSKSIDGRYGIFRSRASRKDASPWDHIPFADFPRDFKLALLLMGVR